MELFPAADEEQFAFIKQIIDQSDYYIIISAGRYGSIHPGTGLSYTEMEYDYAVETGKPVIRLLHKFPEDVRDENSPWEDASAKAKLFAFRAKLESGSLVAYWENADQLGKEVVLALQNVKKTRPAEGWVKTDSVASEQALLELIELRKRVKELESPLAKPKEIEGKLDALKGNINLFEVAIERDRGFGIGLSAGMDKKYKTSNERTEMPCSEFAKCLIYGFLFSENPIYATIFGLGSSEKTSDRYPIHSKTPEKNEEFDVLMMRLETHGFLIATDRVAKSILSDQSFATNSNWILSQEARKWAVGFGIRRA